MCDFWASVFHVELFVDVSAQLHRDVLTMESFLLTYHTFSGSVFRYTLQLFSFLQVRDSSV